MTGNNLPRISLIRGKLFADRYIHPISTAFVVVSRVGCLVITGVCMMVMNVFSRASKIVEKKIN